MRSTTTELAGWLAARPTVLWMADLFTFTLLNGTVLRYASGDTSITYGGNTWLATGPVLERTAWSVKNTTDIPTMDITLSSNGADYSGGNLKLLIHNGAFMGATVQLDRAMGPSPSNIFGTVTLFYGPVGAIKLGAVTAKITTKSWMVVLQQYMPRNTFQPTCIHTLYDAGCTLIRATYTCTNTCNPGSTVTQINTAGNWAIPGGGAATIAQLTPGSLTITSGVAAGTKRTVQGGATSGSGGNIEFSWPLYTPPNSGDSLTCSFGCDKTNNTCLNTFNNLNNNRSFPFIPPAEAAV